MAQPIGQPTTYITKSDKCFGNGGRGFTDENLPEVAHIHPAGKEIYDQSQSSRRGVTNDSYKVNYVNSIKLGVSIKGTDPLTGETRYHDVCRDIPMDVDTDDASRVPHIGLGLTSPQLVKILARDKNHGKLYFLTAVDPNKRVERPKPSDEELYRIDNNRPVVPAVGTVIRSRSRKQRAAAKPKLREPNMSGTSQHNHTVPSVGTATNGG